MGKSDNHNEISGGGLALIGLLVGLATGFAVYGIVEFWLDDRDSAPGPVTLLFATMTAAASFLILAAPGRMMKSIAASMAVAAIFAGPDFYLASVIGDGDQNLTAFPQIFWFAFARGLAAYLTITLVKASLENSAPPPYPAVFHHGVTIPLIFGGAKVFAGLSLVLLFAWGSLLKSMDVDFFEKLFQEPWFMLPFLGAIGGLSIALMRAQQAVLGALRFIISIFSQIVMVILALLTINFLIILIVKGTGVIYEQAYPSAWMIAIALAGMLVFNGVYQNGEAGPPPIWLRLATIVTLLGFPIYALFAFHALSLRIDEYGLTPARISGFAATGLVAIYSVVCLAGLATELNWRGKRWMPLIGKMNIAMALLWIITLTALATPLANPWAMSAKSQYQRLAEGRVAASEFDFAYMRFDLGPFGEKALDKLVALNTHPEAAIIRAEVAALRAAKNRWEYENPNLAPLPGSDDRSLLPTPAEPPGASAEIGPMDLELNPEADTGADDPDNAGQSSDSDDIEADEASN